MEHVVETESDSVEFELPKTDNTHEVPIRVGEPDNTSNSDDPSTPDEQSVTTLSDEDRRSFSSLLTVGQKIVNISLFGHKIKVATPTIDDEIRAGMAVKEYKDSEGYIRAYQAAFVAACIREIDGTPVFSSLSTQPDPEEVFAKKFDYVRGLYPIVVSELWKRILHLETEYMELTKTLGKL